LTTCTSLDEASEGGAAFDFDDADVTSLPPMPRSGQSARRLLTMRFSNWRPMIASHPGSRPMNMQFPFQQKAWQNAIVPRNHKMAAI